jgi:hypothetical protein
MLKSKNEATILLKTKDRAWVRFQNEPKLEANEPILAASEPKGSGHQDSGMAEGPGCAESRCRRNSFKCAKY